MERARDRQGVAGAVEEVGIAERDVGGARLDLLANVREDARRRGTTKKRPPYTGGIGQCRQRCWQPRLAST